MNAIPKIDAKPEQKTKDNRVIGPDRPPRKSQSERDYAEIHTELSKRMDWLRRKATLYVGRTG